MHSTAASIIILFLFTCQCSCLSLYSPDDPLHELDSSNFESIVFKKSNAWIIEFYNNWCGHCIRFAPQWKQFSRDIRTWRSVIDVAVINCADKQNLNLCRDYGVDAYPTIKLFKPYVNESYKGEILKGDRDITSIESSIVKFLEELQDENAPTNWPDLHPLGLNTIKEVSKLIDRDEGSLILFIEHPDSTTGRKVILDLSFQTSVTVKRVLTTNEALLDNMNKQVDNSSAATVVKIDKNGNEELLFRFAQDINSSYIRDQIFKQVVGRPRSESDEVIGSKNNTDKVTIRDSVHMTDLENALRYLLYQEVGVVKHLYGDRLDVLKTFLSVLKNFFPGKPHVMAYISTLQQWVSNQKNITGEKFVKKLDELQTEKEYLPEMKDFVGCRGSEPKYRGYPCSLWTLFHTLTVQAYIADEETAGAVYEDVATVLPIIRQYIKNFFTCEECVQNFVKMDENLERDASTSGNAVLFLWEAHNKVNRRLSGDITEDPQYPKIQFPSSNMCPKCRLKDGDSDQIKWDEVQVLKFLRHFYGKQNIVMDDSAQDGKTSDYTGGNSSMVISLKNVSFYEKWNFQWFTNTDISLCVSLYLVSALLLVLIFFLFRQRRRRKKNQFKYVNFYP